MFLDNFKDRDSLIDAGRFTYSLNSEVVMKLKTYQFYLFFIMFIFPLYAADDWTQQSPASNPQGRYYFGMAYGGNDWALLFGGWSSSFTNLGDTWIYDYSTDTWTIDNVGTSPSPRHGPELAYIGGTNVLLFGGDTGTTNNETWYYNLSLGSWTQLSPVANPAARWIHAMAYIGDDKVLLFGGDVSGVNGETWVFDFSDNNWTQHTPATSPSARYAHDMAYFGGDQVLLFGGATPVGSNETWLFDLSDNNWTLLSPTASPSARTDHTMAYMGDDQVLLYGSSIADNTAWIFDQSNNIWIADPNSGSTPSGRIGAKLAETDMSGNSRIVLFGGRDPALNWPTDTWVFGGGDYPLPVELSSFTVEATNQGVLGKWTTESEIENLGFILERKTEGTDWTEIVSYKTNNGLLGQGTTSNYTYYEYLDTFVEPNTTYEYRLADVDLNGVVNYHATRTVTVKQAPISSVVEKFTVLPAYPNPFNPSTTITYGIETDNNVTIDIYDITGQFVTTLLNTEQTQGWHSIVWNGTNQYGEQAPAGIYLTGIKSGSKVKTTRLMLLK